MIDRKERTAVVIKSGIFRGYVSAAALSGWFLLGGLLALLVIFLHLLGVADGYGENVGRSAFRWIYYQWQEAGGDFAHAWVMPLISLGIVWMRRRDLAMTSKQATWAGTGLMLVGLVLTWLTIRAQQPRLTLLVFSALLWVIPYALYGYATAKRLVFPVLYLGLCFGSFYLLVITFRLRLLASMISELLLNGIGIATMRTGTALYSTAGGGFHFDVADPCSGLRSLVVITALCAPYAVMTQPKRWGMWVIFACSVPFAVIANVARILILAVLASVVSQELALRFYHDFAGYMVFGIAVVLVVLTSHFLKRFQCTSAKASQDIPVLASGAEHGHSLPAGVDGIRSRQYLCGLVMAAMMAVTMEAVRLDRPEVVDDPVPYVLPATLPGYAGDSLIFCQNDQCSAVFLASRRGPLAQCPRCGGLDLQDASLAERTKLPADVEISKRHYEGVTHAFDVSLVRSGLSRSGIHRPEVCLVAQGFRIVDDRVQTVDMADGTSFAVTRLRAVHDAGLAVFYAYWFRCGDLETATHSSRLFRTARDGMVFNIRRRWVYAAVAMRIDPALSEARNAAALNAFLVALYAAVNAPQP